MRGIIVTALVGSLLFFQGWVYADNAVPLESYRESRFLLGTVVTLDVCYGPSQAAALKDAVEKVWDRLGEINVRMNPYDEKSDIVLMNRSAGAWVPVHQDVFSLVQRSIAYKSLTGGVFDVTIGALSKRWKQAVKEGRLPSREEVLAAKSHVDASRIELAEGNRVRLPDAGMIIDLSGDAQGFAADEAAEILRAAGLSRFMMDSGGEIFASGLSCNGAKWRIGVKDPFDAGPFTEVVQLQDRGVSSSGNYEKYFEINGEKWSHIINPLTGYPEKEVSGATVIAPTATDADVLSTALCVLGPVKGIDLINRLGAGYAAVVYSDGPDDKPVRTATAGYEKFRALK